MDTDDFEGYNACGPTSAVMITQFHKLQPENTSGYPGWYVYNPYINWTDKSGSDYDDVGVENGPYDADENDNYIHEIQDGAFGYMVRDYRTVNPEFNCGKYICWGTLEDRLVSYIENHGLIVRQYVKTNPDYYDTIKRNIDAGLPMIGIVTFNTSGHVFVIIGYDTGANGTEEKVIVHDPLINWGTGVPGSGESTDINRVTYPLDGTVGNYTADIHTIYTVHPVGVFQNFPGWKLSGQDPLSQLFLDEYDNEEYNGDTGLNIFGLPWDNNGHSVWAHEWPDAACDPAATPPDTCDDYGLYVQDFLRVDEQENEHWSQLVLNWTIGRAIAVKGWILEYWNGNYGYSAYGPPVTREFETVIDGNHTAAEQVFAVDGVKTVIGYDETSELGYTAEVVAPYEQVISPNSPDTAWWFGSSVAISGNYAVVGEERAFVNQRGRAFIFVKSGSTWSQVATVLTPSSAPLWQNYENFGNAVAVSGDHVMVAGRLYDIPNTNQTNVGAVYFFTTGASPVGERFFDNSAAAGIQMGFSVAMSGDKAVAGAINYTHSGKQYAGAVYFFRYSGGAWQISGPIVVNDGAGGDNLGYSVAISGNYAIVGAPNYGQYDTGAVYFFEYNENTCTWEQACAAVTVPNETGYTHFGRSVAISGDYAIVGRECTGYYPGHAFVFRRNSNGQWTNLGKIQAENGFNNDKFGMNVAISGHRALIGAAGQKSAYVFIMAGDTWTQINKIYNSSYDSNYAKAVAIDGFNAIVGALYGDGYYYDTGVAHTYDLYLEPDYEQ